MIRIVCNFMACFPITSTVRWVGVILSNRVPFCCYILVRKDFVPSSWDKRPWQNNRAHFPFVFPFSFFMCVRLRAFAPVVGSWFPISAFFVYSCASPCLESFVLPLVCMTNNSVLPLSNHVSYLSPPLSISLPPSPSLPVPLALALPLCRSCSPVFLFLCLARGL